MGYREMFAVFGRIGVLSFGGPAAQIALMHRELVEERDWLTEKQFLGALSFCMLLPGPEAMQLATYAGWRLRGIWGGLLAGLLFVLPGALVILGLVLGYAAFGTQDFVQGIFLGIKAAVVIVVLQALLKVSKKALTGVQGWVLAALAFVAIFAFQVPFPLIVFGAGLWGLFAARGSEGGVAPALTRTWAQTLGVALGGAVIWAAPLAVTAWIVPQPLLTEIGLFFSKLAVVTFGGAYAVLAYMAQDVVAAQGWLTAPEMMDGLGLAETTPGPLILVTEFVGALAGHKAGGWPLAVAAASMTLWVTFVPCFIWIFAGAPYIDWITAQPRLRGALAAITAAVVGVIANLSIWFAVHVFFAEVGTAGIGPLRVLAPVFGSVNAVAVGFALLAGGLLWGLRLSLPLVLGLMALAGWAAQIGL
ncbi:chromate efflux transporter [Harenicola maris]